MKKLTHYLLFGLLIIVAGCVPSLNPLYTEADLIFDETLLGRWDSADPAGDWEFMKADKADFEDDLMEELDHRILSDKAYLLRYTDNSSGDISDFIGHLVQIADGLFMDMAPVELSTDHSPEYENSFLPVHSFVKIDKTRTSLELSFVDPDWLSKRLKRKPDALKHVQTTEGLVLTASPKELQAFLSANVGEPGALMEYLTLRRET